MAFLNIQEPDMVGIYLGKTTKSLAAFLKGNHFRD